MKSHLHSFRPLLGMFCTALVAWGSLISPSSSYAQDLPAYEQKQLPTPDGWIISVDSFPQATETAPVTMIVHGENSNALAWKKDYGDTFHQLGYAVAIVDLRMHGNSKTTVTGQKFDTTDLRPTEYPNMIKFDLETVKNFLLEEHQKKKLNIRKLGIIGSDMSVPLVLNFAELDWNKPPYDDAPTFAMQTPRGQDVHAIALISPVLQLPGANTSIPLRNLTMPARGIAFFTAFGTTDSGNNRQAERLEKILQAHAENKERVVIKEYNSNLRGVLLATRTPQLKQDLIDFFDKNLKQYDYPWQDRRTRLVRQAELNSGGFPLTSSSQPHFI